MVRSLILSTCTGTPLYSSSCNKYVETYTVNYCDHNGKIITSDIKETHAVIFAKHINIHNGEVTDKSAEQNHFIKLFDNQTDLANKNNLLPAWYLAYNLPHKLKRANC